METYLERIVELLSLLAELPEAADNHILPRLTDCINRYAELRKSALDELADFASKASSSNSGTQAKWQNRIARMRSDSSNLFGESVSDLMLPPSHQLFWSTSWQAEEKFFDTLSKVATPQLLDDLLTHQQNLTMLAGALQDSWTFLLSVNDGIKNREMEIIQQINSIVQNVLLELDTSSMKIKDNLSRAAEAAKRKSEAIKRLMDKIPESIKDNLEALVEWLKDQLKDELVPEGTPDEFWDQMKVSLERLSLMAEAAGQAATKYRTQLAAYKDLLELQRGSVLRVFTDRRAEVESYLSANSVGNAREWLGQARGQLLSWTSALPTPGQQNDAAAFYEQIDKQLDITWKRTEDIDARFRAQFQGAFISAISDETGEQLVASYLFKKQLEKIEALEAARLLGEFHKLLPEQVSTLETSLTVLDQPTSMMPSEVQGEAKRLNEEFRQFVHDRFKGQIETLLPVIDELVRVFTPEHLEDDLGRRELESMLR